MTVPDSYNWLGAFIQHDQNDWTGDGVLCQLVR
jgi:hypothetical protein